jgi:rod shape determining protein RodA
VDRLKWRLYDYWIIAVLILLLMIGLAMVYSATRNTEGLEDSTRRQAVFIAIGLVLLFLLSTVDYSLLEPLTGAVYVLMIASLVAVLIIGRVTHGAQRWIDLGFMLFQPSEFAKVALVLFLARLFSGQRDHIKAARTFFLSLGATLLPMLLVYMQPDLSTALILGAIWLGMAVIAGVRLVYMMGLGAAGLIAAPAIWLFLHDYQRLRILTFLNPSADPQGAGYNVGQALIAIGSGGWLGQGFTSGTQSQLHFLRVRHTDFIFSVLAEELGFAGSLLLFFLLAFMLWRIIRVAGMARDSFGEFIAMGMATLIFVQSATNIAMNMALIPTTGIPLPFISFGNNALLSLLLGLGLVESVALRHKKLDFV